MATGTCNRPIIIGVVASPEPTKIPLAAWANMLNAKKKKDKRQRGHFRKATKQRIEAKRKGRK